MINRKTKLQLQQLGIIIIAWLMVGFLMSIYDHLVLYTQNSQGPSAQYSFLFSLAMNLGAALMGGLLGGSVLVFFVHVKYQDKPYGYTILAVSVSFLLIVILIILILGAITTPMRTGKSLPDPVAVEAFKNFLLDSARIKNVMVWCIVVSITQLLLQISHKFGQGIFGKILRGKYNTPKEENKIFMFLDLNSSTAMAEQLGDERYHALLKDFYEDITHPILNNKGEVHQYVGDEVVVAWKYEDGIENGQCVRCFFDIKGHIEKQKTKYLQKYGLLPTFKAGIHYGKVVAGEVGIIKRDITYSGDVLNTTSRILSLCKEFNAEIISSADLADKLGLAKNYAAQTLGSIKLRGKEKEVMLSTFNPLAFRA